jgi:hypothetical protein
MRRGCSRASKQLSENAYGGEAQSPVCGQKRLTRQTTKKTVEKPVMMSESETGDHLQPILDCRTWGSDNTWHSSGLPQQSRIT